VKISVVGTGYVGLVSGVCLASKGHDVICVDVDPEKIAKIRRGEPPIYEEGLEALLAEVNGRNFSVTDDLESAVLGTDLTMIAVGTPFDGERIDLGYIEKASAQIGDAISKKDSYHVVVIKSTVVPGTTDGVVLSVLEEHSGKKAGSGFGLGMNPEFLTEGVAIRDFMAPDRIVVGGIDVRSREVIRAVYAGFSDVPIVETNTRTAELIKYASNALLATLISFSNELAALATSVGDIDCTEVMDGLHLSEYLSFTRDGVREKARITSFLNPGCGFGGSCLPKDVKALAAQGQSHGVSMNILNEVIRTNQHQPQRLLEILRRHIPNLKGRTIGVLGLAFKEGTDDMRESPAIPVIESLLADGAQVVAFDPIAMPMAQSILPDAVEYSKDLEGVVAKADAMLLITRWEEFLQLPDLMHDLGREAVLLVDGRRFIEKTAVQNYDGIGL
jgi:UDPglucose 6-dehydrogenase